MRTVLVVEDDPQSLELITDVLTDAGWRVRAAVSGEQAILEATAEPPDLILLDIGLPGIDGNATMRALRGDARTAGLPMVAVTAQAMTGDAERAIAAGFDGYLTKPIDVRGLPTEIEAILQRIDRGP